MQRRLQTVSGLARIACLAATLILAAASIADAAAAAPAEPFVSDPDHAVVSRLAEIARSRSMLLVGELHGTVEVPHLVGAIALHLARDTPVLVALEWPVEEQPRVAAYLDGGGGADAVGVLSRSAFWNRVTRDGRSSKAMLALLEMLRVARADGARIEVVCFDGPSSSAPPDREAGMAEHLRRARAADASPAMLVLTGNYHARISVGAPWNPQMAFVGHRLRDLEPYNVDVGAMVGSAWVCLSGGACGPHRFDHRARGLQGGLVEHAALTDQGYWSTLTLAEFNASPPVVPESSPQEPGPARSGSE